MVGLEYLPPLLSTERRASRARKTVFRREEGISERTSLKRTEIGDRGPARIALAMQPCYNPQMIRSPLFHSIRKANTDASGGARIA